MKNEYYLGHGHIDEARNVYACWEARFFPRIPENMGTIYAEHNHQPIARNKLEVMIQSIFTA